jgi:hypothetical protein
MNIASNNFSTSAAQLRDQYADYFSGAGSVPWQLKAVGTDCSCIINIRYVNIDHFVQQEGCARLLFWFIDITFLLIMQTYAIFYY